MLVEEGLILVTHKEESRFNFIENCFRVAVLHTQLKVIDCEFKMAVGIEAEGRADRPDQRSTFAYAEVVLHRSSAWK